MEVRRCVAAFIPVHVNRYSSEVADPRHAPMLASATRGLARGTFRTGLAQIARRSFDKSLIPRAGSPIAPCPDRRASLGYVQSPQSLARGIILAFPSRTHPAVPGPVNSTDGCGMTLRESDGQDPPT